MQPARHAGPLGSRCIGAITSTADQQPDPHSPLAGFFWGHVGWMLVDNTELRRLGIFDRYAKDILRDPFYRRLERGLLYPAIIVLSWLVFLVAGSAAGLLPATHWRRRRSLARAC